MNPGEYGPYTAGRQAHYMWAVNGAEAKAVTLRLMPYLSGPKRKQAVDAIAKAGL